MMSAGVEVPLNPRLDDIKVPESTLANWQIMANLLAEIAEAPAALIMRVHPRDIEVCVASQSPGNVYHSAETAPLDTGLYCETFMSTRRALLVPNALKDPAWDHNPDIKLGMVSYCGLPLTWPTVYGIVKQNDGFIKVDSAPGQGTAFSIYLPRREGKTEEAGIDGAAKSPARGREAILLVEDEPAVLTLTRKMLERQGYTVLAAGTPGEATRLAREHEGEIHLLMTDVVMPEMNGRVLSSNLLSLYPKLRRLFMSGYTADVIAHHGALDGNVHFIQKPFSIDALAAKVRETLDAAD